MPGIFGLISKKPRELNEEKLRLMQNSMDHDPHNTNTGTYVNELLSIYIGWISHKNTFSDCMPVFNETKDVILFFTGEIYFDEDVTSKLKTKYHEFDENNASLIVHLYEEFGIDFIQTLNGWFNGIILDLNKEDILFFNDRYRMNRVYTYDNYDELLFSHEIKGILKVNEKLRYFNLNSLAQYISFNCVFQDQTLFQGISVMQGGSIWKYHKGENTYKSLYFKPEEWEKQNTLENKIFYNTIKDKFFEILPKYFNSRIPIAMSLTSGLDTRTIISCLKERNVINSFYTFSGKHKNTIDCSIGKNIANYINMDHTTIRIENNFFKEFPSLARQTIYISDGNLDISGAHDIYFNKISRSIAPVRMTGKFGSEILGNHSMLRKPINIENEIFNTEFLKIINIAKDEFKNLEYGNRLTFSVFKEIPWHEYGRLAIERNILTVRTPYMDNDIVKIMYQAPIGTRCTYDLRLNLIRENRNGLIRFLTDRGTAGNNSWLISKFYNLLYFSSFKFEYVYLYQLPRPLFILEKYLSPLHIEKTLLGRYQYLIYPIWFRRELYEYIRYNLLEQETSENQFWNRSYLKKICEHHRRGYRNYYNEINKVLTVGLINKYLINEL